jgi:superkiller protein 3
LTSFGERQGCKYEKTISKCDSQYIVRACACFHPGNSGKPGGELRQTGTKSSTGRCYAGLDKPTDAISAYKQAIRVDPSDASAYYYMGIACGKLGQYQEALEAHKKAIGIKPAFAPAHYNMGLIYGQLLEFEQEMAAYIRAIRVDPDYVPAHFKLGEIYAGHRQI